MSINTTMADGQTGYNTISLDVKKGSHFGVVLQVPLFL